MRHRCAAAITTILAVALITPVAAAKPANGLWANSSAACAAAKKSKAPNSLLEESSEEVIPGDDPNFITVSGKIISNFEIQCTMGKAKGGSTPLACTSEGETWKQKLTVRGAKRISFSGGDGIGGSYIWCRR